MIAEAVFDGFTISRAYPPMINATAGLIANCIVTNYNNYFYHNSINIIGGSTVVSNCVFDGTGLGYGHVNYSQSMVPLSGSAKLINCEVRNRKTTSNMNAGDRAAVMAGESTVMRNCYIHDCSCNFGVNSVYNCGLLAYGSAVVDNCTIINCGGTVNSKGGLAVTGSAKARNNLAFGNWTGKDSTFATNDLYAVAGVTLQNNAYGVGTLPASEEGCFPISDPCFQAGTVVPGKVLAGRGLRLEWMSKGADCQDFYGNPRLVGKPDIGCAESNYRPGFAIIVR